MSVVLVSGCSRGIGLHTALALAAEGLTTLATLRDPEGRDRDVAGRLRDAGVEVLTLDVRDPEAIGAVVEHIHARHGHLDALVANAGQGLAGCFEDLGRQQVVDLFAVNVFGVMDLSRACLPLLRATRGRLVVLSSIAGRRGAPGSSAYNATKFALEGWAEALRFELLPMGVQLVLIEPGPTETGFQASRGRGERSGQGVYGPISDRLAQVMAEGERRREPPERVVAAIRRALSEVSPPFRIPTGSGTRAQILAHRLLPWPVWEALVRRKLALPDLARGGR